MYRISMGFASSAESRQEYDLVMKASHYLSGPMAGYPDHNFPAFEKAAGELTDCGLIVTSPHKIKHIEPVEFEILHGRPMDWHDYLRKDIKVMLEACDSIILLKGWPQSKGAILELEVAVRLGWPVWYYDGFTLTNMNKNGAL